MKCDDADIKKLVDQYMSSSNEKNPDPNKLSPKESNKPINGPSLLPIE